VDIVLGIPELVGDVIPLLHQEGEMIGPEVHLVDDENEVVNEREIEIGVIETVTEIEIAVILGAEMTNLIHVLPKVEVVRLDVIVSVIEKGMEGIEIGIVNAIEIEKEKEKRIKIEREDVKK